MSEIIIKTSSCAKNQIANLNWSLVSNCFITLKIWVDTQANIYFSIYLTLLRVRKVLAVVMLGWFSGISDCYTHTDMQSRRKSLIWFPVVSGSFYFLSHTLLKTKVFYGNEVYCLLKGSLENQKWQFSSSMTSLQKSHNNNG